MGVGLTDACGEMVNPIATPLWKSGQYLEAKTAAECCRLAVDSKDAVDEAAFTVVFDSVGFTVPAPDPTRGTMRGKLSEAVW